MNRLLIAVSVIFLAMPVQASLADGPNHTILWNDVSAVLTVDSFLIAAGPDAITVCRFDDTLASFVPANVVFTEVAPVSLRLCDNHLIIRSVEDRLALYDLSNLPDLSYEGTITPGMSFADYALYNQDLILSRWIYGLWRFGLNGFELAELIDTSMAGMMLTQLEVRNDTLYALDEYQGVMRYSLADEGFGRFIDFLWVKYDMTSFTMLDSLVVIPSATAGVGLGAFGLPGPGIIDSIAGADGAEQVLVTPTRLVLLGPRSFQVADRTDLTIRSSGSVGRGQLPGAVYRHLNRDYLLLPSDGGGLALYDLDETDPPQRPGLFRNGPITAVHLHDGHLYTGGVSNPIDVFAVDTLATPTFSHTLFDGLTHVGAMTGNGDSLIVAYTRPNRVVFIGDGDDPDSFFIQGTVFVEDTTIRQIAYQSAKIDSIRPLLAVGEAQVQVVAITDSSGAYPATAWSATGGLTSALLYDTLLFMATSKKQLVIARVLDDLQLEIRRLADLGDPCSKMMLFENLVGLFLWRDLVLLDVTDPASPVTVDVIELPLPVLDAVRNKDRLYTIGTLGAAVLSVDSLSIEPIETGGIPGSMLTVEGSVLVTSDRGAAHLYHLDADSRPTPDPPPLPTTFTLAQNYPNPFNPNTTIEYSLPVTSHVKLTIYNILGQQVTRLVDKEQPAGVHRVIWDGTDYSGDEVATGVYLYRIEAGDRATSKKMLLLK